jgi:hypothetical protein
MNQKFKLWARLYRSPDDGDGTGDGDISADVGDTSGGTGGGSGGSGSGGGSGSAAPVPASWPDNWRSLVTTDPKQQKTLERFASPKAVYDSYTALRQRMDSGELKMSTPFPDKGTPEEQTAWRKSNAIPDKPGDYNLKFDDGLVMSDVDKPVVDKFLQTAHSLNLPESQVKGMLRWYHETQEQTLNQREELDNAFLHESEDALRSEWGGEYRRNINLIKGLVETMPANVRGEFVGARLQNGNALINHPDIARWLASISRTVNPVSTVVPGAGANVASAIEDEIKTIEGTMKTDRKKYNSDEKMQSRLRDLYNARERASK